jgi:hypothetical protein
MNEFEGCGDMVHGFLSHLKSVARYPQTVNVNERLIECDAVAGDDVGSVLVAQAVTIVSERLCGVPLSR